MPYPEPVFAPAINMNETIWKIESAEFLRFNLYLNEAPCASFSLQRTNPRSFHKISDKELVKPIVENSWTFWSQLFIFPSTQPTVGVRNPPVPNPIHLFLPPLWHKITRLVCVSQVHLYKAPKEMLGDRPFLNIYQRGKPLGEMAHDSRPMAGSDIGVCETSQGSSKSSRKKLKWSQDQAISYPWSDGMAFISTVGWFSW